MAQQVQTAQFFPEETAAQLSGELICYARSVVGPEWEAMDDGSLGDAINLWGANLFRTISTVQPATDTEQSAYDRWMDQTEDRQAARVDRVDGAEGIIPSPLWLVLLVISAVIFAYLLFFADRAEGAVTQGLLMGSVTLVITLLLLLLTFFDHPHGDGVGRLQPTAMERTLGLIDAQLEVAGLDVTPPCDSDGNPRVAAQEEADELDAAAELSAAEVRRYLQRASNYVLTVVLYAVVLFFAGMSTRIANRRLRWTLTGAGFLVMAGALAWIATFPISLEV